MKKLIVLIVCLILCGCSIFKRDKHYTVKVYDIYNYNSYVKGIDLKTELEKANGSVIKSGDSGEGFFTKDLYGTKLKIQVNGRMGYRTVYTVEVWIDGEMIDKEILNGTPTEREYR